MSRELKTGTIQAQLTVIQMMLKLHNKYPAAEEQFVTAHIDEIRRLLGTGPWSTRNLCAKCICVLYRSRTNQMYLMERGVIASLLAVMREKNDELQEAPLVAILSLLSHPDIPKVRSACPVNQSSSTNPFSLLLPTDVPRHPRRSGLDRSVDAEQRRDHPVAFPPRPAPHHHSFSLVSSLSVVLLKTLRVFDIPRVNSVVPENRRYLMDQEDNIPQRVGEEYGGLIEEYLQQIVENRREQHYLLDQVPALPSLLSLSLTVPSSLRRTGRRTA
jgi:hypothetical protein